VTDRIMRLATSMKSWPEVMTGTCKAMSRPRKGNGELTVEPLKIVTLRSLIAYIRHSPE